MIVNIQSEQQTMLRKSVSINGISKSTFLLWLYI